MKTIIQKSILALTLICLLLSAYSVYSQSQRMKDKFYTGFFHFPYKQHFFNSTFLNYYSDLSVNMMQGYGTSEDHDPSNLIGGFYDSLSWYNQNVNSMLSTFSAGLGDSSMLLSRSKISRPAYGQTSTYQAEYGRAQLVNGTTSPGYGYKHGINNYYSGEQWQGETVSGRYCQTGQQTAQYIIDSLYENMEQVNNVTDDLLLSDRKSSITDYRWYVKPRMRIDQSFANNSANWDKNVVRIDIFNFDGDLILSDTLKVLNFLTSGSYAGEYKELFSFGNNSQFAFSVKSSDLTSGATSDEHGVTENLPSSKVDYRVFWFGEVDVWLDYVRVDDEWAHSLFNPTLTIQGRNYLFLERITEEVSAFGNHDGFGYFYIDEYNYNNLPCIAEVNRIIKNINSNTGLISVFCPECTNYGLRNTPDLKDIQSNLSLE